MALASGSRTQLRYKPESTFGTTPGSGNHYNLRITNESLAYDIRTATSNEIRADRQTSDLVLVGAGMQGDVSFELSYGEFDWFLQAALQGTWSTFGTNGVETISATFGTDTLTAGSGTPFSGLVAGQWIYISDAATEANNGWFKIVEVTSSTVLTFASSTFTAEGPTADVLVSTSRLSNGTTQRSATLEVNHGDITQFFAYRGATLSRLSLNIQTGQFVTGTMSFMGKDGLVQGTTTLPGTATVSLTNTVQNAVSNLVNLLEGGAALSGTFIRSLTLNIDNQLRGQEAIGTLGYVGIASGTLSVNGSMEIYLADATLYNKFVNNTATSLSFRLAESAGAGQGYVFTIPNVRYVRSTRSGSQINTDVVLQAEFQGILDSTLGSIVIDRGGAAVALPA